MKNLHKHILWITRTGVLLALLVILQAVTKPLGQIVTGSCVNAVLAVAALLAGVGSAAVVALLSPLCAFVLGIAPQILTVPAIMAGNLCYVLVLALLAGKEKGFSWKRIAGWLAAAVVKFGVLYLLVVKIICGVAAPALLERGVLKAPMLQALPVTFSTPQLVTALIGGGAAVLITPVLRKTVKN